MQQPPASADLEAWFSRRTFGPPFATVPEVAERRRARSLGITVCLPALNEERTIGDICRAVSSTLMNGVGLVEELIVIDSGSDDDTGEAAAAAGATVHHAADILPHLGEARGKGEALWKSLAVATGDLIVWIDADITNFDPAWVAKLVDPLLEDEEIAFVKGFFERSVMGSGGRRLTGGRVTELVVRPLFHLLFPELSRMVQPLSGECAGRTSVLRELPFATGYGVDAALLVDLVDHSGLDAIAQTDLGVLTHRNRDTLELGKMAHEILHVILDRLDTLGRIKLPHDMPEDFVQFLSREDGPLGVAASPTLSQRPPLEDV